MNFDNKIQDEKPGTHDDQHQDVDLDVLYYHGYIWCGDYIVQMMIPTTDNDNAELDHVDKKYMRLKCSRASVVAIFEGYNASESPEDVSSCIRSVSSPNGSHVYTIGEVVCDVEYYRSWKAAQSFGFALINYWPVDGVWATRWPETGQLHVYGQFNHGRKHGRWTTWNIEGDVESEIQYKKGVRYGPYATWHSGHTPIACIKGQYVCDQKNGLWQCFFADGQPKTEQVFFQGQANGMYKEWAATGVMKKEGVYRRGQRNGYWKTYHPNKHLNAAGFYKDDKFNGQWEYYYPSGTIHKRITYVNGVQEGKTEIFFSDGRIKYAGVYVGGLREGMWQEGCRQSHDYVLHTYRHNQLDGLSISYYMNFKSNNSSNDSTAPTTLPTTSTSIVVRIYEKNRIVGGPTMYVQ